MSTPGERERLTQDRVISFLENRLGWRYLGNYKSREQNANIEEALVRAFLEPRYSPTLVRRAIEELRRVARDQSQSLYDVNKAVYALLRYGVKVREDVGEHHQTVWLIDWQQPQRNSFNVAEEVTVSADNTKRPDVVLYVNGLALGVLELKRGTVSVGEGIRQNIDNQQSMFIQRFFATMQLVMAGNYTEGLRYGTIETPEKYYLQWKEDTTEEYDSLLLKHLAQLCRPERFLEIVHDFTLFDGGVKKLCRPHQYHGVRAAQERVRRREGGIIWHCQGSGKSLTMVWLARWIRENMPDARVLVVTDRDELDQQIVRVFGDAGDTMARATAGVDLVDKLNRNEHPLLCTLVHKFGRRDEGDYEGFIEELRKESRASFRAKGNLYVFVDECHRTQSGKLHEAMKELLPDALFIGFTGTPLLRADKKLSEAVFGSFIHWYKFDEAVQDQVVLDLQYEARDVDQRVTDQASIDEWFEAETRGLTDVAKAQLKQQWGTMRQVLSCKDRLEKIVYDIVKDFRVKPRLTTGQGNAMLVAGSVYEACKYYELLERTPLKGHCAIVTSYVPSPKKVKGQNTGDGLNDELMKYKVYKDMLDGQTPEAFEKEVKNRFIKEPARMKLLIVVDKLLTGFDAPAATYLYIDKKMQDHGLFQAICRVNRLDGEDKEFGYIVDYKDLFKSVDRAISDYTTGAFENYDRADVEGLLKDHLAVARERLDMALETLHALCEPVHPRDSKHFIRYFCGNPENAEDLKDTEEKRVALYKHVAALIRAYANAANDMSAMGYSPAETQRVHERVTFYTDLRMEIKLASRDYIDLKRYEPAMRQLMDMYITADASRKISAFDDVSLVQLIVERGEAALDELPAGIRDDKEAMAETIENNIRRVIIEEYPSNPKYYERMSQLLTELVQERRREAQAYETYLKKVLELARQAQAPSSTPAYSQRLNTRALQALYDNLGQNEDLALRIDETVRDTKRDSWRGNMVKEREIKYAIRKQLPEGMDADRIFDLIKHQPDY